MLIPQDEALKSVQHAMHDDISSIQEGTRAIVAVWSMLQAIRYVRQKFYRKYTSLYNWFAQV